MSEPKPLIYWMTTMPNPSVVSHTADAGQRGWRTHAVPQQEFEAELARIKSEGKTLQFRAPRVRALCGLRPGHGWGHDLFIEEKCARCARIAENNGCCDVCSGEGRTMQMVSRNDGSGFGDEKLLPCKVCSGTGHQTEGAKQ